MVKQMDKKLQEQKEVLVLIEESLKYYVGCV
jgi:hypothetical protein